MFQSKTLTEKELLNIDLSRIDDDFLDNLYPFQKLGIQLVIKIKIITKF